MKLLVATTQTQGQRQNDFCWATPGEILHFGSECDREGIDGACGCKRSLSGLDSLKATTTMIVAEVEISDNELRNRLRAHFINDWGMDDAAATEWARVEAVKLMDLGNAFETGDVLERRGSTIRLRKGRRC